MDAPLTFYIGGMSRGGGAPCVGSGGLGLGTPGYRRYRRFLRAAAMIRVLNDDDSSTHHWQLSGHISIYFERYTVPFVERLSR